MVCIRSSAGVTAVDTPLLRAIQIPIGSPIRRQRPTDTPVMISVSMLSDQRPRTPNESMERVTRIVDRMPANA